MMRPVARPLARADERMTPAAAMRRLPSGYISRMSTVSTIFLMAFVAVPLVMLAVIAVLWIALEIFDPQ